MTQLFHGGDLSIARKEFGNPVDGWIDLSTGINPWPWPCSSQTLDSLQRLPDQRALAQLRAVAAKTYGLQGGESVVLAPGSQSLIQWLPHLKKSLRVMALTPSYDEHAHSWSFAGHQVSAVENLPKGCEADVVIVSNPNNPDGRLFSKESISLLADNLAKKSGFLIVDEAFADLSNQASSADQVDKGIIALRSFGKFYGLPGLRLGFALTNPNTAMALAKMLGPWPISSLAVEIGMEALLDAEWQYQTRKRLSWAMRRLEGILENNGCKIIGGTDLFLLVEGDAHSLYNFLGRAGIYVRIFSHKKNWLRFGLPGPEVHWLRLEGEMERWRKR